MEQAEGLNEQPKIQTQLVGTQVSTTSAPEVLIKTMIHLNCLYYLM
ncbi:hypothetical protein [Peribacillus butanolivorans]